MAKNPTIICSARAKMFRSKGYNYTYDLQSGNFLNWGSRINDDPQWCPFGPESLTIEISKGAACPMTCSYCYKNNKIGYPTQSAYMSFSKFKVLFDKLPYSTTKDGKRIFFPYKIDFCITSIDSNPYLLEILFYCKENGVVPNLVVNGKDKTSDTKLKQLVETCGEIGVSINTTNQEDGFDLIQKLLDFGAQKVNLYYVLSTESCDYVYVILNYIETDYRLKGLHSIIFLGLKPKARGTFFGILQESAYKNLVTYCLDNNVCFGFDTCSSPMFEKILRECDATTKQKKRLRPYLQRCTAGLFSAYIDCDGKYWQCPFGEGNEEACGIDVLNSDKSFDDTVWNTEQIENWRWKLVKKKRKCPLYEEINLKQ